MTVVDSTDLSLEQVIDVICALVPTITSRLAPADPARAPTTLEARARSDRGWLNTSTERSDMTEHDTAAPQPRGTLPVVAVVGRPNVGKSTLVNRILGRREAVVQDVPGVTRDRVSYDADWNGRSFVLVDTGGWAPDAKGLAAQIAEQAELAIATADAVLLVVDGTVGTLDSDEAVVRVLRRSKKPVVLAVNKVDDQRAEAEAATHVEPRARRAVPGLRAARAGERRPAGRHPRRPAAGARRSTSTGRARAAPRRHRRQAERRQVQPAQQARRQQRVVVHDMAGTTVDPVDELVEVDGQTYVFIDTAGIRRRVKEASGHEYYASLRTQGAIERAEVCVAVLDASEPLTEQDVRILTSVEEAGRALVIAYNKWDLTDEERRHYLGREVEQDIAPFAWASHVNISAQTGRHVDRLGPALQEALPAGRPGSPRASSTRSSAGSSPPTRTRSAAASSRGSSSGRRRRPGRRPSCSSPAASSSPATSASSSAGCARSSASSAPRCTSRSGRGRSAASADATARSLRRGAQSGISRTAVGARSRRRQDRTH